jgi:hypothetical protein
MQVSSKEISTLAYENHGRNYEKYLNPLPSLFLNNFYLPFRPSATVLVARLISSGIFQLHLDTETHSQN